jgi:pimeloyl-ACP methyl ester carboxylesterase
MQEPILYYEVHGEKGPFLLLVHGLLSSRAQWLPNLPALSAFCRPVVVELLGHARSPTPDDPAAYAPAAYGDEFERIRQKLGVERWLVCGQSLGAALTVRYALDHPGRVIAQIFTNSNSALAEDGWAEGVRAAMKLQARRLTSEGRAWLEDSPLNPVRNQRLSPEVRAALLADYALHTPLGIARTGLYTVPDSAVRHRIVENEVPALLIAGEREARFREHTRFAEKTMPHIEVLRLDAGHAVNLEVPLEFNEAIAKFMGEHARE